MVNGTPANWFVTLSCTANGSYLKTMTHGRLFVWNRSTVPTHTHTYIYRYRNGRLSVPMRNMYYKQFKLQQMIVILAS